MAAANGAAKGVGVFWRGVSPSYVMQQENIKL